MVIRPKVLFSRIRSLPTLRGTIRIPTSISAVLVDTGKRRLKARTVIANPPHVGLVRTMGCGKLKVECEDGFQVISKDAHELVHMVQTHVKNMHHKAVSESDVMAMAKHP